LRVECLPCRSRHHNARTFSKARWICSFFGHSYTVLRTATKSASPSSGAAWVTLSGTAPAGRKKLGDIEVGDGADRNREFKYYRLTEKGRKQLVVEESQWKQMAEAVARVMWPAVEES
jgi:hypothetical protein